MTKPIDGSEKQDQSKEPFNTFSQIAEVENPNEASLENLQLSIT
jgi:hypothetical protein